MICFYFDVFVYNLYSKSFKSNGEKIDDNLKFKPTLISLLLMLCQNIASSYYFQVIYLYQLYTKITTKVLHILFSNRVFL